MRKFCHTGPLGRQMDENVSGRHAETKIRGRKLQENKEKAAKKAEEEEKAKERKKKYDAWGKGYVNRVPCPDCFASSLSLLRVRSIYISRFRRAFITSSRNDMPAISRFSPSRSLHCRLSSDPAVRRCLISPKLYPSPPLSQSVRASVCVQSLTLTIPHLCLRLRVSLCAV